MRIAENELPDDPQQLKQLIVALSEQGRETEHERVRLERKVEVLLDEVSLLRMKLFGKSSEKLSEQEILQGLLFDVEPQAESAAEESVEVPSHRRRKPKRRPLPADLPREDIIHDIAEDQKICGCGAPLVRIGEETNEKLDVIPQTLKVIRHIRPKYACRECEGSGDEENPAVRISPAVPQLIPKGIASAGLMAYIITSKFCDALPYYRQTKQFERIGIDIARSSMCEWVSETAKRCEPLVELMKDQIRSGPLIQMDETTVQVLGEPGKENTSKSYMWVARGGKPDHPLLLYQYHRGRSKQIPLEYLNGYSGYLQTDGYKGYDDAGKQPGITHVGCWAHVRRKFYDAQRASKKTGSADQGVGRIGKLYAIERKLRAQLGAGQIDDQHFVSLRCELAQPILDQFRRWLEKRYDQIPPSTFLGTAVEYALRQWPKLVRYLEQSYLTPDTNLVENAIRPFVLGRKNWLFSGSPRGAYASSTLYSLIETAKANSIEPYRYLRFLFERIPTAESKEDLEKFLPHQIDAAFSNTS